MSNFPLRLSDSLKARAQARAEAMGISLNALVCVALDQYLGPEQPARPVTQQPRREPSQPRPQPVKQPSRTGPCPCGSGKKYKRCCAATK